MYSDALVAAQAAQEPRRLEADGIGDRLPAGIVESYLNPLTGP